MEVVYSASVYVLVDGAAGNEPVEGYVGTALKCGSGSRDETEGQKKSDTDHNDEVLIRHACMDTDILWLFRSFSRRPSSRMFHFLDLQLVFVVALYLSSDFPWVVLQEVQSHFALEFLLAL